ncbi:MAG: DUF4398 domain-containing protein [Polyangiaceae bacterium]|nr:DUF4398 domain-containing protein [Polyangiaceae bacterium]
MRIAVGSVIASFALVTACGGSAPVPDAEHTKALADIRAAEEIGAAQVPKAALHLKMARDQVATAERLIADGENEDASLVLARAQADADVAIALSHEVTLRTQAQAMREKIDKLKKEAAAMPAHGQVKSKDQLKSK